MSSSSVICSPARAAAASDSMTSFESWLAGTFPKAGVTARSGTGVRALEWTLGDGDRWMDGSINEDRTAIYLSGDPDLMAATAVAARDLFPDEFPVTYTEDWQGIAFDLRRIRDANSLVAAAAAGDVTFEWRRSSGRGTT